MRRYRPALGPIAADDPISQARRTRPSCRGYSNWAGSRAATCAFDDRWAGGNAARHAQIRGGIGSRLRPTFILAQAGSESGAVAAGDSHRCRSCSRIVPDPVGAGFVDSLSRPGGNATGFMMFEYSLCGKWLELLKEIAAGRLTRGGAFFGDAANTRRRSANSPQIQAVAPSLGVEVQPGRHGASRRDRARTSRPSRALPNERL